MFASFGHRRLKTPSGWVVRVLRHDETIFVYREGLLDSHPVDELLLKWESRSPKKDFKRIVAGLWANVIDPTGGPLEPRPDRELKSVHELKDEQRWWGSFWTEVRRQEQALQAKRLSGR